MKNTVRLVILTQALGVCLAGAQTPTYTYTPVATHSIILQLTSGPNNPAAQPYAANQVNATALQIELYAPSPAGSSSIVLQQMVFHLAGNLNPVTGIVPGSVRLFRDNGATAGFYDALDTLVVGGQSFSAGGAVTFSGSALQALTVPFNPAPHLPLILVFDLNAAVGNQFTVSLNCLQDITVLGYYMTTPWPVAMWGSAAGNTHNAVLPVETPTATPTGCAKYFFYTDSLPANPVGGGQTVVGYSGHGGSGGGCLCTYETTSLTFSVSTTGNLNTEIQQVLLNSSISGTLAGGQVNFTGTLPTNFEVGYVLSPAAQGTIVTNLIAAGGNGSCGYAGILMYVTPVTLTVMPPTRTPTQTPFSTPTPTMTGCSKLTFTLSGSGAVTGGNAATLGGDFGWPYGFGACYQDYFVTDITFDINASGNLDSRITEVRLRQNSVTVATLPFTGTGSYRFTGSPLMSALDGNHGAFSLDFPTASDAAGTLQLALVYTMPLTMISGYGTAGFAVVLPEPAPVSVTVVPAGGATDTPVATATPGVSGTVTPVYAFDGLDDGDLVNSTNGDWFTYRWTYINERTPITPWQANVMPGTLVGGDPNPDLLSGAVFHSASYSVQVTGRVLLNGPVTYAGFALGTRLSAGYRDLSYLGILRFWVRADRPCTLRAQFTDPDIEACNGDQYGYTFVVPTADTWQQVGIPRASITCQDWGVGTCPPCGIVLDAALADCESIDFQTACAPGVDCTYVPSLQFWLDDLEIEARTGYPVPPTATPLATSQGTAVPTNTATPVPTNTWTWTPADTLTPTATPTRTPTRTATVTPTLTSTDSSPVVTMSPTPMPSETQPWTETSSPTATPSAAASPPAALPLRPVEAPIAFPNPVREGDTVRVAVMLGEDSPTVKVQLRTIAGRKIREMDLGPMKAGAGEANWVNFDLKGVEDAAPANGVYLLTVTTPRDKATSKLLILK